MKTRWASSAVLLLLASLGPAPLAAADSDGGNGGFVNMAAKQDGLEATTNQSAVANLASGRDLRGNAFGCRWCFRCGSRVRWLIQGILTRVPAKRPRWVV